MKNYFDDFDLYESCEECFQEEDFVYIFPKEDENELNSLFDK